MGKVKVMMAIARKKDNGKINKGSEEKAIKMIFDEENRDFILRNLKGIIAQYSEYDWRIYENANWRDTTKAYLLLNRQISGWQMNGDIFGWTKDLHNKWLSCLMAPESRFSGDTNVILDLDNPELEEAFDAFLEINVVSVQEKYKTPNGVHYIVNAIDSRMFDDTIFSGKIDIIRDGLKLIYFKED